MALQAARFEADPVIGQHEIRDHVESVVSDHRDQSVRAKVIPPPERDAGTDSLEVEVPPGKRNSRNTLKSA
jgi:hypothetical protein